MLRDRILYLSKLTLQTVVTLGMANQSWSRTKFGGHTYTLGAISGQSSIKTRPKIAKIKPIGGQQVERTDFRSAFLVIYVNFHWNWSHHIIIWVINIKKKLVHIKLVCNGGLVVTQIQHKRSAGLSPPPTQCPQFPNQPEFCGKSKTSESYLLGLIQQEPCEKWWQILFSNPLALSSHLDHIWPYEGVMYYFFRCKTQLWKPEFKGIALLDEGFISNKIFFSSSNYNPLLESCPPKVK